MMEETADDLVAFRNVRLIEASVSALWCAIGARSVWLPRLHVQGRLRSRGDRGTLRIRRWLALERQLPMPSAAAPPTRDAHVHPRIRLLRPKLAPA